MIEFAVSKIEGPSRPERAVEMFLYRNDYDTVGYTTVELVLLRRWQLFLSIRRRGRGTWANQQDRALP